jgi:hypothetical protein
MTTECASAFSRHDLPEFCNDNRPKRKRAQATLKRGRRESRMRYAALAFSAVAAEA